MNHKDLIRHELIGLNVQILQDSNPNNDLKSGKIIDESKNLFFILQGSKVRKITKKNAVFKFSLSDCDAVIDGKLFVGRPDERIKKKIRKKW